jgi:hypothetical protein
MAKTTTITLGGENYTVHAFNIGELRRVTGLFNAANGVGTVDNVSAAFGILQIAMERAEPKPPDFNTLEPESLDEVIKASNAILELAGVVQKANPPEAPAAP